MKILLSRLLLAGPLAIAAAAVSADPDLPHYRVEIIAFSHLDGRPDGRRGESIVDFAHLVDPWRQALERDHALVRRQDENDTADSEDPDHQADIEAVLALIDQLERLEDGTPAPRIPTWPTPYLALESLSPAMSQARDRLEDSPRHRMLAWRAWHQPLPSPGSGERVRLHDQWPVSMDWVRLSATGAPLGQRPLTLADWMPRMQFRLDGMIRLRQRQFMHLDVDLHWREPLDEFEPPTTGGPIASAGTSDFAPTRFRLHRLQDSRTVRTGRLEYFDSSWLGLLVRIEPIEPLDGGAEEDEAATSQSQTEALGEDS